MSKMVLLFTDPNNVNSRITIRDTFNACLSLGLSFYSHEWNKDAKNLIKVMGFDDPDVIPCALCITDKTSVYLYTDLFDTLDKYTFTLEKIFNVRQKNRSSKTTR